jgi:hypothetical protein
VDGIIFVLNVDEGLNWGPVKQALQYLPEGSVFIICVTSGNEDAEALSAARRQVQASGAAVLCNVRNVSDLTS